MIYELSPQDAGLFDTLPICYIGGYIKSYFHAYGFGYSFLKFYASDIGALMAVEGERAYLYAEKTAVTPELIAFLSGICSCCFTNAKLNLDRYRFSSGYCYISPEGFEKQNADIISYSQEIAPAYYILSNVFPESINKESYMGWYTDISHRTRHKKAFIFTMPRVSTVTVKAVEDGFGIVVELATSKRCRKGGNAKKLLLAAACKLNCRLILASQNAESNEFYEHIGFLKSDEWYCYNKDI